MENYRISPEAAVYYLTYSVVEWLPVFVSEASCKIITASRLIAKRLQEAPGTMMVFLPMTIRPGADRERRFWQPSRQPEAV